jgi:hypothetical protein
VNRTIGLRIVRASRRLGQSSIAGRRLARRAHLQCTRAHDGLVTTDHCRYFWRLLSRRARLYTEMVTTGALIHGDRPRLLAFNPEEQPVALQLGGSDPADLARCARWAEDWGYAEVNLNCGCPRTGYRTAPSVPA